MNPEVNDDEDEEDEEDYRSERSGSLLRKNSWDDVSH
jgi:hypothetical protein